MAHAPKTPQTPKGFQQSIFRGQVRGAGRRACEQLVHSSLVG